MLRNVINLCPENLWYKEKKFFYMAYHTTIFLDYYLTNPVSDFQPALSYTIVDADEIPAEGIDDVIPNEHYSKKEMLEYLTSIREKCKKLILETSPEKLHAHWIKDDEIDLHGLCPSIVENYTLLEIIFYNFRHVQHHVGQLNFLLRQKADVAAEWVGMVDE